MTPYDWVKDKERMSKVRNLALTVTATIGVILILQDVGPCRNSWAFEDAEKAAQYQKATNEKLQSLDATTEGLSTEIDEVKGDVKNLDQKVTMQSQVQWAVYESLRGKRATKKLKKALGQ